MECRSLLTSSPSLLTYRRRIVCASSSSSSSRQTSRVSRRVALHRFISLSGVAVASQLLPKRMSLAKDASPDLTTEAEEEIPELEEELSTIPEVERKAVEAELDVLEKEVTEAEEKVIEGKVTPQEAKEAALSIQDILDAVRSAIGL